MHSLGINDIQLILLLACLAGIVILWIKLSSSSENENLQKHLLELDNRLGEQQVRFKELHEHLIVIPVSQEKRLSELQEALLKTLQRHETRFERRQVQVLKILNDTLLKTARHARAQVNELIQKNTTSMEHHMDKLTQSTDERLKSISGQVEQRLNEGFEKTTATFADVVKRLALIDEAQKKITELSTNVVSLQEVLSDKRSRGAFGEIQLSALVKNVLPEKSFQLQYSLSNSKIADCMLFLPEPTGNVAIDSKFPLESYQRMLDIDSANSSRREAKRQFKLDVKKHIKDIAEKYIIPNETSNGAMMFLPAEAVFAEIQAHHPDLVELAQTSHVWICSPTTMMAILNTARAVIKDDATRRQIHIIQEHLAGLSADFSRFKKRMDNLSTHIRQAHEDAEQVNISANKISSHFKKIENVELEEKNHEKIES